MKTETKAIMASIVVIALALAAVSGVTYSWFSDSDKADIDVTVGAVDISLDNVGVKLYSNGTEQTSGEFAAGGTVTVSEKIITISNIADRDKVEIYGDIINKSSIKTIYRTSIVEVDASGNRVSSNTELFNALTAGSPTSTVWRDAPIAGPTGTTLVDNGLLATIGFDNYTGSSTSCRIQVIMEAYQSNADVDRSVSQATVAGTNTFNVESTDASTGLNSAVITVEGVPESDAGKIILAGEAGDSYSINGLIAGVSLKEDSSSASSLFVGQKAKITMIVDGVYNEGEISIYHKGVLFTPDSAKGEEIVVTPGTTTTVIEIVTYKGFSEYQVAKRLVQVGPTNYDTISEAVESATENSIVKILGDYIVKDLENVTISKNISITADSKVVLTNVRFTIEAAVAISDLTLVKTVDSATYQHIITLSGSGCNAVLSDVDFIAASDRDKTIAPVYSNRDSHSNGVLKVENCTFSMASDVDRDVKRHALELYNLSSATITGCTFNDFSRPVNLDGVMETVASGNAFIMPAGAKDGNLEGLLKVYSINKDITSFSATDDSINWKSSEDITTAYVFINSDVAVSGDFVSDEEVYIKDKATFRIDGSFKNLALKGQGKDAVFDMIEKAISNNEGVVSFSDLTYKAGTSDYKGIQHAYKVTFSNCTLTGRSTLYAASVSFDNCTFVQDAVDYSIWTYGAGEVTFENCVFNSKGKAVLVYSEDKSSTQTVFFKGCEFYSTDPSEKAAIEIDTSLVKSRKIVIEDVKHLDDKFAGLYHVKKSNRDNAEIVFTVSTAEELRMLQKTVNAGFSFNESVVLDADIDLESKEWTPIGGDGSTFTGNFDGNSHTISNLEINKPWTHDVGLFGYTKGMSTTGAEIKNLTVHNAKVTGNQEVGVVVGCPYTTKYSSISVTGHVEVNGVSYVGGVGGKNAYNHWTDILVDVDETSYVKAESGEKWRSYVGGIIGFMGEGSQIMKNMTSNIDVIGSTCDVGGITGIAHYGNTFINCSSSGNVTLVNASDDGDQLEIGGIAGVWNNLDGKKVTFTGCSFTGKLSSKLNGVAVEESEFPNGKLVGRAYSPSGTGELIIDGVVIHR